MEIERILLSYTGPHAKEEAETYLADQGILDDIINLRNDEDRLDPVYEDLARLHVVVRERKIVNVLEFGVGFSTLVMADALLKNLREHRAISEGTGIRHSMVFELHAVDTSPEWIARTEATIPSRLREIVHLSQSDAVAGRFQGRACHYYEKLPDIVPHLIYLDGPDPKDVSGDLGGLSWACPDRVVTAGDVLRMEPQLLPGTVLISDGRTANARFLAAHLYRSWKVEHSYAADITVLELEEPPLGTRGRTWQWR